MCRNHSSLGIESQGQKLSAEMCVVHVDYLLRRHHMS